MTKRTFQTDVDVFLDECESWTPASARPFALMLQDAVFHATLVDDQAISLLDDVATALTLPSELLREWMHGRSLPPSGIAENVMWAVHTVLSTRDNERLLRWRIAHTKDG